MKKKKLKKILKKLKALKLEENPHFSHIEADGLLCKILRAHGYKEIIYAFNDLKKWYS